jgi:hypothetical protein
MIAGIEEPGMGQPQSDPQMQAQEISSDPSQSDFSNPMPPIDFNQGPPVGQGGLGIPGEIPQQTTTRPMPSNQKGTARPVFNEREMGVASKLFSEDPQDSLGKNAPMFNANSNKYNNQQLT